MSVRWPPAAGRGLLLAAAATAALAVLAPLVALAIAFADARGEVWTHLGATILPEAIRNTALLAGLVGLGSGVLGVALAWLVATRTFPLSRVFDWALLLPLAAPAYVVGFVFVALLEFAGPVQHAMREALGPGARLPDVRSLWGVAFVMTLVLYPYVYLLARGAFAQLDASQMEAARSLGLSRTAAFRRVALPAARPAIAAGCALAMMEALADFGTVSVFGVRTLTEAIYRVWFGMFDRVAATQLASVLLLVTFALLAVERWSRGRARVSQAHGRPVAAIYPPLRGWRAGLACLACALVLGLAFVLPLGVLVVWAFSSGDAWAPSRDLPLVANTLRLATVAAALTVAGALVFAYARRVDGRRLARAASAVARLGYSVPGPVLAVGALVCFAGVDRMVLPHLPAGVAAWLPPLLTGSLVGLLAAYFARFAALALLPVEAGLGRLGPELDEAARTLGASPARLAARIHAPLLRGSLAAAFLLVLVDVMKEMPVTLLLRPLGTDTLAVAVWQRTTEGLWEAAAVPSLTIVAAGLVPVALVHRLGEAWREQSRRRAA